MIFTFHTFNDDVYILLPLQRLCLSSQNFFVRSLSSFYTAGWFYRKAKSPAAAVRTHITHKKTFFSVEKKKPFNKTALFSSKLLLFLKNKYISYKTWMNSPLLNSPLKFWSRRGL